MIEHEDPAGALPNGSYDAEQDIEALLGHLDAKAPSEHMLGLGRRFDAGVEDAFEDPAQPVPATNMPPYTRD